LEAAILKNSFEKPFFRIAVSKEPYETATAVE